jgi:hypothetical protein
VLSCSGPLLVPLRIIHVSVMYHIVTDVYLLLQAGPPEHSLTKLSKRPLKVSLQNPRISTSSWDCVGNGSHSTRVPPRRRRSITAGQLSTGWAEAAMSSAQSTDGKPMASTISMLLPRMVICRALRCRMLHGRVDTGAYWALIGHSSAA